MVHKHGNKINSSKDRAYFSRVMTLDLGAVKALLKERGFGN